MPGSNHPEGTLYWPTTPIALLWPHHKQAFLGRAGHTTMLVEPQDFESVERSPGET